ncbi:MAG: hypothetical protein CMG00_08290 [Candidatus Marinimicrobia bacterium]|nr:hypothetical protein [Candidatus Neomarinimicrobiota bacterium]|tara:strand:- start:8 stop:217 length:210 start_codon:yes stop_codon:yes gene_type:complete
MKNILMGFLISTCMFLMIGTTQEMFITSSENGRYIPIPCRDRVCMMDSRTGDFYASDYGIWKIDTKLSE